MASSTKRTGEGMRPSIEKKDLQGVGGIATINITKADQSVDPAVKP
jgi:hypothetical protein